MLPDSSTPLPAGAKAIHFRGERAGGRVCLVDAELYESLRGYAWTFSQGGRVMRMTTESERRDGFPTHVFLARVVMGATPRVSNAMQVDHINGDPLDNRRSNLRLVTASQNHANVPGRGGASRYRGVTWCAQTGRWRAQVKSGGKFRHVGRFDREEDAARAFDREALRLWGDAAFLNFPPPGRAQHGAAGGGRLVAAGEGHQ